MEVFDQYELLTQFAFLPDRLLQKIREKTGILDSRNSLLERLNNEYIDRKKANMPNIFEYYIDNIKIDTLEQANKIYMISNMRCSKDQERLVLSYKPNSRQGNRPWELINVLTEKEYRDDFYIDLGDKPSKMLFNFCFWPRWQEDLLHLSTLALPENWSYGDNKDDVRILDNYIKNTFAKAWIDKLVIASKNRQYATFNTGLVNKNYKYIYVLMERQEKNLANKTNWKFLTFSMPGVGQDGRMLTENFSKYPMPIRYFNDISDVSYIIDKERPTEDQTPELQPDHYFIDHPERLPKEFLKDGCRKSPELLGLLETDISSYEPDIVRNYWKQIGQKIGENQEVYDDMDASFRNAVRKAIMRVSWNYRTAIPVYFPTRNKMSILLPLSFSSDGNAEVALVVERNPNSKTYLAPTILDLQTAYSNARLVCKPESEWLNPQTIKPSLVSTDEE